MKLKVADIVRITQPLPGSGRPKSALQHLADAAVSPELSLAALLLSDHVQAAMEQYERIRIRLNEKYGGELDKARGRYEFPSDEAYRQFEAAFERLLAHELELDCEPLRWEDLRGSGTSQAPVTAAQLSMLRPVVDGIPAAPGEDYNPLAEIEGELLAGEEATE